MKLAAAWTPNSTPCSSSVRAYSSGVTSRDGAWVAPAISGALRG